MPNVGKSTLFNLLSKQHVPAENYPFCTIDPTNARVPVPDERFDKLLAHFTPKSEVPAVLTITDIAGLVRGAHEGKGLGNEFLSNISSVDAIYHVVRAFKDKEVEHVEGEVDPVRDLKIINDELLLKDKKFVDFKCDELKRIVDRGIDKQKKPIYEFMVKLQEWVEAGKDVREGDWAPAEIPLLNELQLLSAKPIVYLVNISLKDFEEGKNKWIKEIKKFASERSPGAPVLPFSATFEAKWEAGSAEDKQKNVEKKLISQLPKIIVTG